jgi:hypothetical protein
MRIMPKFFLVLTRCLPDRWALWTAQAKSLKKWRAGQNNTANTYVIDIEIIATRLAQGRVAAAAGSSG